MRYIIIFYYKPKTHNAYGFNIIIKIILPVLQIVALKTLSQNLNIDDIKIYIKAKKYHLTHKR